MGAYIVGMITGTVCLVVPLFYLMNVDRCLAKLYASGQQTAELFLKHTQVSLAYGTAIVGAVVVLVCTALVAFTGASRIKKARPKPQGPAPAADEAAGQV